jgi:hypothetical protein
MKKWFEGMEKQISEDVQRTRADYAKAILQSRTVITIHSNLHNEVIEKEENKIRAREAWQRAVKAEREWDERCKRNGWERTT